LGGSFNYPDENLLTNYLRLVSLLILYGKDFLIFDRLLDDIGKYHHILPYKVQSAYIPMQDDTLIAVDIITEKGSIVERPTFLQLGHRWHEKDYIKQLNPLVQEGYNIAIVDVRGTGASAGIRSLLWPRTELEDLNGIIQWITQQPWSDGKIITYGSDYAATTSEFSALINNEAIKANILFGGAYDLYSEAIFPGGIFLERAVEAWSSKNRDYELQKIKIVQDPLYHLGISDIKHQHQSNTNIYDSFFSIQFSDEKINSESNVDISSISVSHYSDEICRNRSPMFSVGSWYNGKTASSVINRFLNYSKSFIGIIGPWDNYLRQVKNSKSQSHSLPYKQLLLLEYVRFAKKSITDPTSIPRLLYYYTLGEGKWKVTETWPLPTQQMMTLYFNHKHMLTIDPPELKGLKSEYRVDFKSTTGANSRWHTPFDNPVNYSNRGKQDKKCIVFTTPTFKDSFEITGHPHVIIQLSSMHEDGTIFVYLELINKRKVYYLTEGQLRLIHWKSTNKHSYKTPTIYRSFTKSESELLKPNLIYDIRIPLEPISVKIPENSKIRIAIAGADSNNFKIYTEATKPHPIWNIYHNSEFPSIIQLPVIKSLT